MIFRSVEAQNFCRHEDLASLLSDLPSCDSDFEMDGRDGLECSDADKSIESSPGLGWEYERQAETFEARSEGNHPKSTSSLMMNPREDFPAQSGGEISRDPRLRMGSNLSAMTSLPEEHGIPQAQNYLDSSEQGHAKLGSQDNGARVQEAENPAVLRGQKLLEETYMCAVPQEKTRESPKNQLAVINGSPGQIISNAEVHNEVSSSPSQLFLDKFIKICRLYRTSHPPSPSFAIFPCLREYVVTVGFVPEFRHQICHESGT